MYLPEQEQHSPRTGAALPPQQTGHSSTSLWGSPVPAGPLSSVHLHRSDNRGEKLHWSKRKKKSRRSHEQQGWDSTQTHQQLRLDRLPAGQCNSDPREGLGCLLRHRPRVLHHLGAILHLNVIWERNKEVKQGISVLQGAKSSRPRVQEGGLYITMKPLTQCLGLKRLPCAIICP